MFRAIKGSLSTGVWDVCVRRESRGRAVTFKSTPLMMLASISWVSSAVKTAPRPAGI